MRIALVVVAVVAAALAGRSVAAGCARRASTLRAAMDALQALRIQMLERHLPLHAALERSQFEPFARAGARVAGGEDAAQAWRAVQEAARKRGGKLDSLTREDAEAFETFFDGLGTGTRLAQEALFSAALRDLGRLEDEARSVGAQKSRLYTTLGLLCALMLAIAFV